MALGGEANSGERRAVRQIICTLTLGAIFSAIIGWQLGSRLFVPCEWDKEMDVLEVAFYTLRGGRVLRIAYLEEMHLGHWHQGLRLCVLAVALY